MSAPRGPGYWMNETGGELALAMHRYLNGHRLSASDIALIRAYLVQWIDADVWNLNPDGTTAFLDELQTLREKARKLTTVRAIEEWVAVATDWGIDPL